MLTHHLDSPIPRNLIAAAPRRMKPLDAPYFYGGRSAMFRRCNSGAHQFARIAERGSKRLPIGIPRSNIYTTPSSSFYHRPGKTGAGGGSVSWDFMCPSERSAPPGIRTRLPVEENNHEQKNYQKNCRGEQDAIRPETNEKSTRNQKTGRFTDEKGAGAERSRDLHR